MLPDASGRPFCGASKSFRLLKCFLLHHFIVVALIVHLFPEDQKIEFCDYGRSRRQGGLMDRYVFCVCMYMHIYKNGIHMYKRSLNTKEVPVPPRWKWTNYQMNHHRREIDAERGLDSKDDVPSSTDVHIFDILTKNRKMCGPSF